MSRLPQLQHARKTQVQCLSHDGNTNKHLWGSVAVLHDKCVPPSSLLSLRSRYALPPLSDRQTAKWADRCVVAATIHALRTYITKSPFPETGPQWDAFEVLLIFRKVPNHSDAAHWRSLLGMLECMAGGRNLSTLPDLNNATLHGLRKRCFTQR